MSVVCTSLLCCRCGSVFCPFWFWTSLFVLVLTLVLSLWLCVLLDFGVVVVAGEQQSQSCALARPQQPLHRVPPPCRR